MRRLSARQMSVSVVQGGEEEALASGITTGPERWLKRRSRERRAGDVRNMVGTTPEKLLAARPSRRMRGGRGRVIRSASEGEAPQRLMATTAAEEQWHVTPRQRKCLVLEAPNQAASTTTGSWVTTVLSTRSAVRSADEATSGIGRSRRGRRKRRGEGRSTLVAMAEVGAHPMSRWVR
jgi:hypothetical protein